MKLLYERNSIEQSYPPITRSVLLTAPIIILCILHYEYGGELQEKRLFKHVKRSYSQLTQNLRKLEERNFILCEKYGRQVKIHITQSGINFISNYSKNAVKIFISFLDFLSKLNRISKMAEIELIKIVLREFLNNSDVFTIIDRLNEKYSKKRKILQQKKYYEKIFEECEQNIVGDTLTHKVFSFLIQNHNVSKQTLSQNFPGAKPGTLSTLYRKWENIIYEKYVFPNL